MQQVLHYTKNGQDFTLTVNMHLLAAASVAAAAPVTATTSVATAASVTATAPVTAATSVAAAT